MDAAVWGFIGVVVGGAIAGLVSLGAEVIRTNREAMLDSTRRQDDRQIERERFERATLIGMQDAAHAALIALADPSPSFAAAEALNQLAALSSRSSHEDARTAGAAVVNAGFDALGTAGAQQKAKMTEYGVALRNLVDTTGPIVGQSFRP